MPTSILHSVRRLLPKQNIPAKFNAISATINSIHQRYTSQFGAPSYPFLQIVIVCMSAPPVPFWSRLHQKNTTSHSDLQRLFDLNMKNTLSNLPGVIVMYRLSAPPVSFWSCLYQKYTTSFSDVQRLFDVNMKSTSNLPGEEGYVYHPEGNIRWYYLRVSTLTANTSRTI